MKLPTLQQAHAAITALATVTGQGATVAAAEGLVDIVVDLFDGKPADQAALKAEYQAARDRTDAALDRLDAAIAERERDG